MKVITIFDLDGVLVDNVDYERAVTDDIVNTIRIQMGLSFEAAFAKWNETLAAHSHDPRWHDYGLHCSALGLPDAWQASHRAMRHLIRQMPHATDAIKVGCQSGPCWLASDATSWVVQFKLQAAGIEPTNFGQIFTLDRCGASKGDGAYWRYVSDHINEPHVNFIYIDNRMDRLITAARLFPSWRTVYVAADDHPLSLRLFSTLSPPDGMHLYRTTHNDLPDTLDTLIGTINQAE